MTEASELLKELGRLGVQVRLQPTGRITLDGPRGAVSAPLLAQLALHKPALAGLLRLREAWTNEVSLMHGGWNEDWLGWSAASREGWARQMMVLALGHGFARLVPCAAWDWIERLASPGRGNIDG